MLWEPATHRASGAPASPPLPAGSLLGCYRGNCPGATPPQPTPWSCLGPEDGGWASVGIQPPHLQLLFGEMHSEFQSDQPVNELLEHILGGEAASLPTARRRRARAKRQTGWKNGSGISSIFVFRSGFWLVGREGCWERSVRKCGQTCHSWVPAETSPADLDAINEVFHK